MLNRRYLRIKAMQHLYALEQCLEADNCVGKDYINDAFEPDFKEEGKRDKEEMKNKKDAALKLFEGYLGGKNYDPDDKDEEVSKIVKDAILYKENLYNKDMHHLKTLMVEGTENIFNWYLLFLQLLVEIADISSEFNRKKTIKEPSPGLPKNNHNNFFNNDVINILRKNNSFRSLLGEKELNWNKYLNELKRWYRELIKVDEDFQSYQSIQHPDFYQDKEIIDHLVKHLVFKSDLVDHFMESMVITWAEDKKIIKNMVYKTLNNLDSNKVESLKLRSLSPDWEEDKDFFIKLFNVTAENYQENEKLIAKTTQNWAVERIAVIDNLILNMAISEMIHYPGIPVKVTINEYIEIAKKYSTPKSKQFVNGILDVLSKDLQEKSLIKKSGRGMLDNK